jgi:hypothetical protein
MPTPRQNRSSLGITLFLLAAAISCVSAQHAESTPELSRAVARSLLSQSLEVGEVEINIAYVLEGDKGLKSGFTSRSAAAVVYIATELENGHRRRRCREQIFLYNVNFGWFLEQVVEEPNRDYLRIWSEHKGYLEFK